MSQPKSTPTGNFTYYSAHRGPVRRPNGEFHHFARQCDPIHTRNGYWKFSSYKDDRRAYENGLDTPEAVLIAQDVGDGVYDDIMLCWVSGELDPGNKSTVGTAAAHLETIYNERRVLGKPLSFRGRVPLYPMSTDQRLIDYRLMRYGIQKDVVPEASLVSPSLQHLSSSMASSPVTSASCSQHRASASVLASASAPRQIDRSPPDDKQFGCPLPATHLQSTPSRVRSFAPFTSPQVTSPLAQSTGIGGYRSTSIQEQAQKAIITSSARSRPQTPATTPAQSSTESRKTSRASAPPHMFTPTAPNGILRPLPSPHTKYRSELLPGSLIAPVNAPRNTAPVRSNPPAFNRQHVPSKSADPTLHAQKHHLRASPLDPRLRGRTKPTSVCTPNHADNPSQSPASIFENLDELSTVKHDKDNYVIPNYYGATEGLSEEFCPPTCKDLTPSQLYDAQSATLPCMSCGIVGAHASQCWIKEAAISLKATEELSALNYRELTADVKRFDPGPWTTHVGPPKEVALEEPDTQVQQMAEIIRNLSTSAEDPDLQTLEDQFTVLLWALKSSGSFQIMKSVYSDSGLGESVHEDYDMPDAWWSST